MIATRIGFLFEHPTWTQPVREALHQRGVAVEAIDVGAIQWRVDQAPPAVDWWINRVNSMPSIGRPASVVASTGHILAWLELHGQRVVNGSAVHRIGSSKAAQGALFARIGMDTPASVAVGHPTDVHAAMETLGCPVLVKPNVGGSGVGIRRFDEPSQLDDAAALDPIDLGADGTGIVQRVIESADGLVHRIEMLGHEVLYATAQPLATDGFNYCAVDGTAAVGGSALRLTEPADAVVHQAAACMAAAEADVGSIEYIVDADTGRPNFFDFNPYSNFITGYDDELGFDPIERYLDFVLASS